MTELELTLDIFDEEQDPNFGFENLQPVTDERVLSEIDKLLNIPKSNVKRLTILKLEKIDDMIKIQLSTNNDFLMFKDMEDLRNYVYLSIDKVYGNRSSQCLKDIFMKIIEIRLIIETSPKNENKFDLMELELDLIGLRDMLDSYHIDSDIF